MKDWLSGMNINTRLARLIDLVPFITQHQGIAIEDLASKFGISVKELEQDLWLLYCCGLPGQTPLELMEFAFEDGFVSVRNAEELKQPRSLSKPELAITVMGLELLARSGDELAQSLSRKLQDQLRGSIELQPDAGQLNIRNIEEAIQKNRLLKIRYKTKEREIIPYEIYTDNSVSYLRAFCKLAGAWRTFRINKIQTLEVLDKAELPPNEVESSEILHRAKIKAHARARTVREIFGSTDEINFYSKEWLIRETLAMAGDVEALTPDIRQKVRDLALAGKKLYLG